MIERADHGVTVAGVHHDVHPEDLPAAAVGDLVLADQSHAPRLVAQPVRLRTLEHVATAVGLDPALPRSILHETSLVDVRETLLRDTQTSLVDPAGLGAEQQVVSDAV